MKNREKLTIEMTKEGAFIDPPQHDYFRGTFDRNRIPLAARIKRTAIVIVALGVAALALTFALTLIAVVVAASAIAGLAYRFQLWRTRRG